MTNTAKITKQEIDELQDLLVRLTDSCKGYKSACELAESPTLETLFEKRSKQRDKFCEEIRTCLRECGAENDMDGSMEAGAHRKFMELRSDMGGHDEAILKEVCRGESLLVESYEDALEDCTPSSKIYSILTRQLSSVRADLQDAKQKAELLD